MPKRSSTQWATAGAPAYFVSGARRGCRALRLTGGTPAALPQPAQSTVGVRRVYRALQHQRACSAVWTVRMVEERQGTLNKPGVGWTKDNAAPVQRRPPRTPRRCTPTRVNHTEGGRGMSWSVHALGDPEDSDRPMAVPKCGTGRTPPAPPQRSARHPQPSRGAPCAHATHPVVGGLRPTRRPPWRGGTWWTTRTTDGGMEVLGCTHTETRRGKCWTTRVQRGVGSKNRKTTPTLTPTLTPHSHQHSPGLH